MENAAPQFRAELVGADDRLVAKCQNSSNYDETNKYRSKNAAPFTRNACFSRSLSREHDETFERRKADILEDYEVNQRHDGNDFAGNGVTDDFLGE